MKQINVRFLAILVSVSLVSLVCLFFLYQYQKNRRADGLLVRAEENEDAGKYQEAARFYMRYIQRRPDDDEVYKKLALTMKKMIEEMLEEGYAAVDPRSLQSTYGVIEEALRKNPDDITLREAGVEFAMRFRRLTDAINHLNHLLQIGDEDNVAEWKVKLARCYAQSGQEDLAKQTLVELVGFDEGGRTFDEATAPTQLSEDAHLLLATIYRQNERDAESADRIMDRLIELNPESHTAYLKRAFYHKTKGERGKELAERDISKALELAPEDFNVLISAAQMKLDNQQLDEAKRLLDQCLENLSDTAEVSDTAEDSRKARKARKVQVHLVLSDWAVKSNDVEQAIEYLRDGLEIDPDSRALLWPLSNLELSRKNFDAVQEISTKMKALNFPRFYVDFLEARVLLAQENWLESSQKLEQVRPQIEQLQPVWTPGLNAQLARCYAKLGQQDLRLKSYQRILDIKPDDKPARWGKIQALLALGQITDALEEYEVLDRQFGEEGISDPQLLLTRLQMEVLQQEQLSKSRQNWTQARQLVQRVMREQRINPVERAQVVAAYFYAVGDKERGDEIIANARLRAPNNLSLMVKEIQDLASNNNLAAALERLEDYERKAGKSVTTRLLRTGLLRTSDPDAAKQALVQLESDAERLEEDARLSVYRKIGDMYVQMNDYSAARQAWQRVAGLRPNDFDIQISLFELALQLGEEERMQDSLTALERILGRDSAQWKWAEAARIAWQVRNQQQPATALDTAQGLIDEAISLRESWEPLYRLQAEVHLSRNRIGAAIEALERSLDVGKGNSTVFRQLIRLYYASERFDDAERILNRLPQAEWLDREKRIWLDILAKRQELPEELPFDIAAADADGQLWMGKLLINAGRFDEAEAAIRKSVEQRPTNPDVWLTLVKLLTLTGRQDEATEMVQKAQLELLETQIPVFLATCYEMLEDHEQAEKYYLEALQAPGDQAPIRQRLVTMYINTQEVEKAREQLEIMMQKGDGDAANDANLKWARLAMAGVKATTGSYRDYQDAVNLIEQNVDKKGALRPHEATLLGQITLRRPDGASRQRVIEKFEDIQRLRKSLTFGEKLLLAQLYYQQGMWSDCRSLMNELLSKRSTDIRLLDPWLRWLLEKDELQQASKWVQNCPPVSLTALRTKAHIDVRRGRTRQALAGLAKIVPANLPPESAGQLKAVARILEELAAYDVKIAPAADKIWKRYYTMRPSDALSYASYLGRRGGEENVRQAMDICGQQLQQGHTRPAIQVAVSVLRANRRSLAERQAYDSQVAQWFDQAQQELPADLMLLIQRSEFEEITGNFAEHERWLRKLLKDSNANQIQRAMVANNLAYLLALNGTGEEPMQLVKFAMQILGPTADLRDTLGMVFLRQNNFDQAIDEFLAAIGDGGPTGFKYAHLARAHWEAGHQADAAEAAIRALTMRDDLSKMNDLEYDNFVNMVKEMQSEGLLEGQEEKVNPMINAQVNKAA